MAWALSSTRQRYPKKANLYDQEAVFPIHRSSSNGLKLKFDYSVDEVAAVENVDALWEGGEVKGYQA